MKNLLLLIAIIFLGLSSYGQDGQDLSNKLEKRQAKEEYCMIKATSRVLSTKVNIEVDFGQARSLWKDNQSLKDEDGKKLVFNSVIDALNYMAEEGWEFINAYTISNDVGDNVLHYIMKRKLKEGTEKP